MDYNLYTHIISSSETMDYIERLEEEQIRKFFASVYFLMSLQLRRSLSFLSTIAFEAFRDYFYRIKYLITTTYSRIPVGTYAYHFSAFIRWLDWFFRTHESGNDFSAKYEDFTFVEQPAIVINLKSVHLSKRFKTLSRMCLKWF